MRTRRALGLHAVLPLLPPRARRITSDAVWLRRRGLPKHTEGQCVLSDLLYSVRPTFQCMEFAWGTCAAHRPS